MRIIIFILCFNSSLLDASDHSKEDVEEDRIVLIVGSKEHHNFERWFNEEDLKIIEETGTEVSYTDNPEEILPVFHNWKSCILVITNLSGSGTAQWYF